MENYSKERKNCPVCEHICADNAHVCPECGYVFKNNNGHAMAWVSFGLSLLNLLLIFVVPLFSIVLIVICIILATGDIRKSGRSAPASIALTITVISIIFMILVAIMAITANIQGFQSLVNNTTNKVNTTGDNEFQNLVDSFTNRVNTAGDITTNDLFVDNNGNGVFDFGDSYIDTNRDGMINDIPIIDTNDDGVQDDPNINVDIEGYQQNNNLNNYYDSIREAQEYLGLGSNY